MKKHPHTASLKIILVCALFLSACGTELPRNSASVNTQSPPTETITPAQSITPIPSVTFTPEPTPTLTPIPSIVLLPPFSPDCTSPTLIRANGSYNGIVPNPYDSAMAPGGSGDIYQGHSDFQRPKGCKDNAVYAPASGVIKGYQNKGVHLLLDAGVLLQLNPDNSPEYSDAINYWYKKYNYRPVITLSIAHIKQVHEDGKVAAGDILGYLTYEANVPMVAYQIQMNPSPQDNAEATIWSPVLFSWTIQPMCLMHCEMKLNNYYQKP